MSASLQSLMMPSVTTAPDERGLVAGIATFIGIGALGAVSFVVLSSLMVWVGTGVEAWLVNALCYAALIVPVYILHRRFSFQSDASHWRAMPRYMAVQGMALLLAAVFSFLVHELLALPTVSASILVIVLTSGVNFVVLRSWAFAQTQWTAPIAP